MVWWRKNKLLFNGANFIRSDAAAVADFSVSMYAFRQHISHNGLTWDAPKSAREPWIKKEMRVQFNGTPGGKASLGAHWSLLIPHSQVC
jgi:hypothetical protein